MAVVNSIPRYADQKCDSCYICGEGGDLVGCELEEKEQQLWNISSSGQRAGTSRQSILEDIKKKRRLFKESGKWQGTDETLDEELTRMESQSNEE